MRKYTVALFAMALLLSACQFESNVLIDVSEDGSAVITTEVGVDRALLDLTTQAGGEFVPGDILGEIPAAAVGGTALEFLEHIEGDMMFFSVKAVVDNLSTYDFRGIQDEIREQVFSDFSFEMDESSATIAATIDPVDPGAFGADELDELPIDRAALIGDLFAANLNLVVTMPGTVTEHNAHEVRADGSLVWAMSLITPTEIFATSTFDDTGIGWIWFVLGGVLSVGILAGAAAAIMSIMSRRDSEKTVEATEAAYARTENRDLTLRTET